MAELLKHPWLVNATSKIGKEYMIGCMEDKTEVINKMKEVFNGSVQEHIKKLIVHYKLLDTEIRNYMKFFDKYFKEFGKTKTHIILMINKIIRELIESKIDIEIEGFKFSLKLEYVNTFKEHIRNLKEFLASQHKINPIELEKINL